MATILITGGTGMIGTALTKGLVKRNHEVIILTRDTSGLPVKPNVSYAQWDLHKQTIDKNAIAAADAIVHLAGANVAEGRWTEKRKKEILDSRVKSGALIVKALKEIPNKVNAVISASAIGYYGPQPLVPDPKPFTETDSPANDFLGKVTQQWESTISEVKELHKRLVIVRTGIVLSNKGGAYKEFRKPLKFGLATILGSGKQIISWITIDDLVRVYIEALGNENWNGAFNAVAPEPVTNKELVMQMARQQMVFIPVHAPSFALKIALGEMSIEVLKSAKVSSEKIIENGFQFLYPTIKDAIQKLKGS